MKNRSNNDYWLIYCCNICNSFNKVKNTGTNQFKILLNCQKCNKETIHSVNRLCK